MVRYDRTITVFSLDGHLFQVEYDLGPSARGTPLSASMAPTPSSPPYPQFRSMSKIAGIDTHIALVCTGLKADARVLINRACVKWQSHHLRHLLRLEGQCHWPQPQLHARVPGKELQGDLLCPKLLPRP
uniref:Proteasome alpha-type subunits domain-containing protein n=1 Tax=Oryza brachyantha TaxID=4533 RepID=J3MKC1_ORYBR